jgi:dipeptidyl aminopeptidase/acylaminoacyl peptidase
MATYSDTPLAREEAVTFHNGSATLAGTLVLPRLKSPCPGVVLIHGSGDDTRDDYRMFADHFAQHGIACLIYDKRGVGASTGSWRAGTFAELADDALAGVRLLAQHAEIDQQRIGLWGCSEGGWVAPLAASQSAQVRFVVAVSPPGMSPVAQEEYRRKLLIMGSSRFRLRRAWRRANIRMLFRILRHSPKRLLPGLAGYFARTMDFDPLQYWKGVTQPVLLIFGADDKAVPPQQSAAMIEAALREAGNQDFTIRIFPNGDHGIQFRNGETKQRMFVPGYLDMVATWIAVR